MAKNPASRTRWSWRCSAKKYILAALLGMLATLAVVAGISISLAPAHISFSIASGGRVIDRQNDYYYNFTVVANNSISSRTAVQYGSLSAQIWYKPTAWVPAELNTTTADDAEHHEQQQLPAVPVPVWHQPGNATDFPIWAQYNEVNEAEVAEDKDSSGVNITWPKCKVVVEAKVRFRFSLVTTRQYTIRASCYPVDFWDGVTAPIDCT